MKNSKRVFAATIAQSTLITIFFFQSAFAQITVIDKPEFFGETFRVGIGEFANYVVGEATLIDFDLAPDGIPFETIIVVPGSDIRRTAVAVTTTYLKYNVRFPDGNEYPATTVFPTNPISIVP